MRIPSALPAWAALLAACCAAGCASRLAPKDWLPLAVDAQSDAHGGWISLEVKGPSATTVHQGELLAVSADSIFVLEDSTCFGVPTAQVAEATLMGYDSDKGKLGLWTFAGTLSTASHGWGLILSAPVWLITGITGTAVQSHAPQMKLRSSSWARARAYARFPQGLPDGLDRSSLRPKDPPIGSEWASHGGRKR
jgi:hypothetical protein